VWLNAVLHAPPVKALEAAWRSAAFLVSHMEFRKGLRLSLLNAPLAALSDRLINLLINPVFDAGADAPDLIVADYPFSNTAPEVAALDELAQHGASLPAVVLANVSPAFLGVKFAWQVTTLPALIAMFDQWKFATWKTLRAQLYSRALAVVFGRCMLRAPYRVEAAADGVFAYREECMSDKDLLWAGGAIAAAAAVAASVAKNGWPTAMAGYVYGRVEGFTTAEGGPKGDKKFGPADVLLPPPKIEEFAAGGINVASGIKDHEDAIVWNGLTAARPQKMDPTSFLEVSLPYQLFATRLSSLLLSIRPTLTGQSAEQVTAKVFAHLREWLGLGEEAQEQINVQTRPAEDGTGLQLAVTVTPPKNILPGEVPVVLGYKVT